MPALIVSVALAPAMTELDERLVLAPEGAPLTLNETVCAEPLVTAVEIVDVPEPPGGSVTLLGEALIEKSLIGGLVTVRLTVVEWLVLVPKPVMVSV